MSLRRSVGSVNSSAFPHGAALLLTFPVNLFAALCCAASRWRLNQQGGVPILAWDQGHYLDPNRFAWGQPDTAATSVPYFDERCGERFAGTDDLEEKLSIFIEKIKASVYSPRDFVMENLTLQGCAEQFLSFFK